MPNINKTISEIEADLELIAALQNALPVINTNKTTLGLSAQQVTDLTNVCNTYFTQYQTMLTAKQAAKSAATTKDTNKRTAKNAYLAWAKQWRANANIPDALLEQIFVAPHQTPKSTAPPATPTNLQALADMHGQIELRFSKNGNKQGTQFIIETRDSATADWALIGVTTKSKYTFSAPVGEYIAMRVTASRGDQLSVPSVPTILWDNGAGNTLQIAA